MPSSEFPPEQTTSVKPFDPLVLDRALIAVPLLRQMDEEFALMAQMRQQVPDFMPIYNSVIRLNEDYPGAEKRSEDGKRLGHETQQGEERYSPNLLGALNHARDLAKASAKKVLNAFFKKLDRFEEEGRSVEDVNIERERREELKRAIAEQVIEEPLPGTVYCFARLHAAIVARMLRANERVSDDPNRRPIEKLLPTRFEVIIDLNLEHPGGREAARKWVFDNVPGAKQAVGVSDAGQEMHVEKSRLSKQYLFGRLEARVIQELIKRDIVQAKHSADERRELIQDPKLRAQLEPTKYRAIYHVWPDFKVSACITKSASTVKADAAQISFSARGSGIVWAVMDSGVDMTHQHFIKNDNIDSNSQWHRDFTADGGDPLTDDNGHGTHVAGIIAGEWDVAPDTPEDERPLAVSRYRKSDSKDIEYQATRLDYICGMAPECKLVSLKVLDEDGKGSASSLIAAIAHVQEINGYGRRLLVHGVNMSLGYIFEPEWFACGQSPLCVEVDRLVKSGVVVVTAAGNTGFGTLKSSAGTTAAGMALTINDPGNAELAITVGATHRDMPHAYGVSYFSSKGPTGDGRLKPDLVAPGEKIVSCCNWQSSGRGGSRVCLSVRGNQWHEHGRAAC